MRCFLFPRVVWFLLVEISSSMPHTFLSIDPILDSALLQTVDTTIPAFTQSHPGLGDRLFKETPSCSQELILQCERQNKKIRLLIRRLDAALQENQARFKASQLRLALIPAAFPFCHFFYNDDTNLSTNYLGPTRY